ncbi:glycosyltransferase [Marinilabiliaceae bacterium JC017]|nr:glycosyltransferase [Marinilabiliaceae bacterium JC017]
MSKEKILLFFTDSFPYNRFEPYIEEETELLSLNFDKIYVFPININHHEKRNVPDNFKVVDIHNKITGNFKYLIKYSKYLFEALYLEYNPLGIIKNNKNQSLRKTSLKSNLTSIYNGLCYAHAIKTFIKDNIDSSNSFITGYSYWYYQWSLINAIMRKMNILNYSITRAHSYDLYDEIKYNLFSEFKIRSLDKVLPVSIHGEKYLKDKHPNLKYKIHKNYLGTNNYGINPLIDSNKKVICSCSTIRDIKRIHLIIEILKEINDEVTWIHFGDGPLFKTIYNLAKELPDNIKYMLIGHKPNEYILNYYSNNQINLFINVSEKEGLPVSLMEAISFGIPVLGTDIFGVSEIVNDSTGILINKDFNITNVANTIKSFFNSHLNTNEFRLGVRNYWKHNFSRKKNFKELFK